MDMKNFIDLLTNHILTPRQVIDTLKYINEADPMPAQCICCGAPLQPMDDEGNVLENDTDPDWDHSGYHHTDDCPATLLNTALIGMYEDGRVKVV